MTILGLNYTKLNIEVKPITHTKLSINTTPKILNVTKTQIKAGENTLPILVIDFSFTSVFDPEIGKLKINGNVIFQPQDEKKVMSFWKKNKKLPKQEEIDVINYLFAKVTPFALFLSELFKMPPIINLPKIKFDENVGGKEEEKKTEKK